MMKQQFVVGFMVNAAGAMLMIEKQRPEWQKGKVNGVGGKVELLETPHSAMVREFKEETGLDTVAQAWNRKLVVSGPNFDLHVFAARGDFGKAFSTTDEKLVVVDPSAPLPPVLASTRWLIPLVLDPAVRGPAIVAYDEPNQA